MSKFNVARTAPTATSVLTAEPTPSATNHRGGAGYQRDLQTELMLLAASNFVGEDDFHETGPQRDDRYAALVHEATLVDADWVSRMLVYVRTVLDLRTAALVGAAELIRVRSVNGIGDDSCVQCERGVGRRTVDGVCQRPDEPGEMTAYWLRYYGRKMPTPLKRGLGDAANRLYHGRSLLAYDANPNKLVRFGDVIELAHPRPSANLAGVGDLAEMSDQQRADLERSRRQYKSDVFRAALDRRRNRPRPWVGRVTTLQARADLMAIPVQERRAVLAREDAPRVLREAGMTWQSLAGWLQGPMDAQAWAAILPSMGYMAKLRNLRNFDAKGLPDELAGQVAAELCDPERVAVSRQLPMRYLSAYRAVQSDRWSWALDKALDLSLRRITVLDGDTLVLVDTSASMDRQLSARSTLRRWDAAVLFGLAVARRCASATVVSFSNGYHGHLGSREFELRQGESLMRAIRRWNDDGFMINAGTDTVGALRRHYSGQRRVVVVTDEQAEHDGMTVTEAVPADVPLYTWNLAGYQYGHTPSGAGNRFVIGGLNDAAFSMVPILEARGHAGWPF